MPNRRLTSDEIAQANELLGDVRKQLFKLSGNDADLLFAYRRKVYKELIYDERDKPMVRRKLKIAKRKEQSDICPLCRKTLPEKYCVLDRFVAAKGYTSENTQLICQDCDINTQKSRKYS